MISNFDDYLKKYKESVESPEKFWSSYAENFKWEKKWDDILKWDFRVPKVEWFRNAKLNITTNCLDRHLRKHSKKIAYKWIPNDPKEDSISITYEQLHMEVSKFSNVLTKNGVKKGDRVCIYMPMLIELTIAVLACARVGAIHSVVFAGFSAQALSERINDATCKLLITSDGSYRGEKEIKLKEICDEALENTPTIESCIVFKRTGSEVKMRNGRDKWWHEEMKDISNIFEPIIVDAEDPLFILYTSGSTGKPKGIQHSTAGYMIYTSFSFKNVFQYEEDDIYWCTADIGWITGHSYIIYGPLLNRASSILFEGIPSYPDFGRFWKIVEENKVNIFYTAPTAIRALEAKGLKYVKPYNLRSLKVLGTVGEPINEDAWNWYNKNIGEKDIPIVDTWWQTETGGIMISNLAGVTPSKATFATLPLPGIQPCIMDNDGNELNNLNVEGKLCIKFPWPSMARTIYGDHKRFKDTYFSTFENMYFTGDGCIRDNEGMYRITGRVDDVIIVSGHNLGTAEIESAIDEHPNVCETAIVGYPHKIKGNAIYAFVITQGDIKNEINTRAEINNLIVKNVGPIAKVEKIQFVKGLPKTRSGKIMRRILRKIASNDFSNFGDTSTLLDPNVVEEIIREKI